MYNIQADVTILARKYGTQKVQSVSGTTWKRQLTWLVNAFRQLIVLLKGEKKINAVILDG